MPLYCRGHGAPCSEGNHAYAGPGKTVGCRVKKGGTVVHYFLVADDDRDKLYLFIFESPEKQWEDNWKIGETLLKKLYIEFPTK